MGSLTSLIHSVLEWFESNEQFIAMPVNEPRNSEQYNGFALDVCITITSNFRDDHIVDKITIMYTYAFHSPQ